MRSTRCLFWVLAGVLGITARAPMASPLPALPRRTAGAAPASVTLAAPAHALSPVDTLHMSLLERAFWGRGGLMRRTGFFPLDDAHPVNDFRQLAHVRRKMLSMHQMLGLATMASMAVTVYGGQRAIDGHGAGLHKASLPFTIGLYSLTAAMALGSPPKLVPSRGGMDTIKFHKLFAALHLGGMILTPMIAPGGNSSKTERRRHQISGYSTFGAFTSGMLVVMVFD